MHLIKEKARRAAKVYGKERESQQYQDYPSQRETRIRAREASHPRPLFVPPDRTPPDLSPETHETSSSHNVLRVRDRNEFLARPPGILATLRIPRCMQCRRRRQKTKLCDSFYNSTTIPPISKHSLSELDIEEVIANAKLRHDVKFDWNLCFRPNLDGKTVRDMDEIIEIVERYWTRLLDDLRIERRPPVHALWANPDLSVENAQLSRVPLMHKDLPIVELKGNQALADWKAQAGKSKSWRCAPKLVLQRASYLGRHQGGPSRLYEQSSFYIRPLWILYAYVRTQQCSKRDGRLVREHWPTKRRKRKHQIEMDGDSKSPESLDNDQDFWHPALNSAYVNTHFDLYTEPGPLLIRFTWDKKIVTAATLERFIAIGTIFTSRWLSWRVEKFLRNDNHADVYSVTDLGFSDPIVEELIATRVHRLLELKNSVEVEAHVFFDNVEGNWRTYASRHMKRLKNDGYTLDSLHWGGRRVLIRQVRSKQTSFKLVNSETEFPSLPTQKGSTKVKYSRQPPYPRQFSYAQALREKFSGRSKFVASVQLFHEHLKLWIQEQQKQETARQKRGEKQKRKRQAKRGERRARKLSDHDNGALEKGSEATFSSHADIVEPLVLPVISETQEMRGSVSLVNVEAMRDLKYKTLSGMRCSNSDLESHIDGRSLPSTQTDFKLVEKRESQPSETEVTVNIGNIQSIAEHLHAEEVDGMLSGLVEVESSEIDPESSVDADDKNQPHTHEPKEGQQESAKTNTDPPAKLDMLKEAEGLARTGLPAPPKPPTREPWRPPTIEQIENDLIRPLERSSNINGKRESEKKTLTPESKAVKLNDLKKFARTFKLNTPVPLDLVPILAKDEAKQQRIVSAALQAAENPTLRAVRDTKNALGAWVVDVKDTVPERGRKKRNADRLLKYGKKKGLKVSREPAR
ncbi:hypothetical protein K432DRAFT_447475 [Lepidopterella palustris CBS 459.81]|uniref:Uncharacterized protein n=1 Tax=Lepidopterella palustris CBS 459.81 TaxID=1314670 RepID=A0A8E2DYL5_9PEZI|nr:hypothetical protein K432DRAFT_447475 [Lepidopterella palustris CBS 459.81]